MRVAINIEANGLNPDKIWCIVCKDLDTGELHVWKNPSGNPSELSSFADFANSITRVVGHNVLGYDLVVLNALCGINLHHALTASSRRDVSTSKRVEVTDTLILSRMVDFSRKSHSTTSFAEEFGIDKPKQPPYKEYSEDLVSYCILLTDIANRIYTKYYKYISNTNYREAIELEHRFQLIVNKLHTNGFFFNSKKASKLLDNVITELAILDKDILSAFPPREVLIREFTPKATKHGTISRSSVPRTLHERIYEYEVGRTYQHTRLEPFNPASHKQLIDVLAEAGWSPVDKTSTHLETERELRQLKHQKNKLPEVDIRIQEAHTSLSRLGKYGWKINENNLSTLPDTAPPAAKSLARRILLESRRRTLTEWLGLVNNQTGRIHGDFQGIGAWTHRMSHQKPNTANIPNEFDTLGKKKLLGKEMRSLWCAPRNRLLVGVDAEGIQLRIFAHYINDPEFTRALVEGKKDDKSDPHSLNQRILGSVCKSRAAAKRFIYALLLGAGLAKLAEILAASEQETKSALERLLERYTGFAHLKETLIPTDARRGYFIGLDGRPVAIPGDTVGTRKHLCMSGYLQNGEAIIMKRACLLWHDQLTEEEIDFLLVNFVHDEWQTETANKVDKALYIAKIQAQALEQVGRDLKLNCPLAGSYWNDDLKDYTIATNWAYTH